MLKESSKKVLLWVLYVLSTIPFFLIIKRPEAWSASSAASYLSSVLGFMGIMALLWMYILGTRAVSGLYFRDLPWTLRTHRWLGTYGLILVFLHPFLMAYVYAENVVTYWLAPRLDTQFEQHVTYGRIGFILLLVVWATSALLRGRLKYRPWKYIHYITYAILPLSLLHIHELGVSMGLSWVQFYFYTTIFVFAVVSILRVRHFFGYGKLPYDVVEHRALNQKVHLLKLRTGGKKLGIRPGQYVYIQLSLFREEHPFSVADYNPESGELVLVYKVFGSFTSKLSTIREGTQVYLDGPYGTFTEELTDSRSPAVFIAGGIGITPFMKHISKRGASDDTWLFYATQYVDTAIFDQALRAKLGQNYVRVLSRDESPAADHDERGYVDQNLLKKYLRDPENYLYYLCGAKAMMNDVRKSLEGMGVPNSQIYTEQFDF